MIVLALVVLFTGLALAYMSRTTTDRQLAQVSYNDTSADLLARSALDIVVSDFKQEILSHPTVTPNPPNCYITPVPYTPVPQVAGSPIANLIRQSFSGDPTGRTSNVNSTFASANGRSTSLARWNSHYLIPLANTSDNTIDSTPVGLNQSHYSSFTAPDWVLVTAQGPAQAPAPSAVIGRYAFAVYDEGGLLDMSMAGYPSWSGNPASGCTPSPTPWLVNVGRKGIMAFADLTALPWPSVAPSPSTRIDNIVGWRNYAMTQRTSGSFGNFSYTPETDCTKQDFYGSYLLNFGDPPFIIDNLSDKLLASIYPFTSAAAYVSNNLTDQSLMTRQELLKVVLALGSSSTGYNQNVLQYMGTFSRERNRPAPGWPGLAGRLGEGRFNLNNLALVEPNPADCILAHGKKKGWQTGKNKNHLCGDDEDVHRLFGLFWVRADVVGGQHPKGEWRYIGNRNPIPGPTGTPAPIPIGCLIGPNQQNDFFQILDYALFQAACETDDQHLAKTFGIGASLIDQYDSGDPCHGNNPNNFETGCDLDSHVKQASKQNRTHTTVIVYGQGNGNSSTAYGMEPNYNSDNTNGDDPWQGTCGSNQSGNNPHRPCLAPTPGASTQVISHFFATVGEFGYGIDTSTAGLPTLDFSSPNYQDAPVLDFFGYNPISSAYPRAGIVNLYTRNAPVLAAILSRTFKKDPGPTPSPAASPVVSASEAMNAANAIVTETKNVLAGSPGYGPVTQADLTRAIAARLAAAGGGAIGSSTEEKESVARALAEMGQTRTWNLLIDVIAQTGKYKPNAPDLTGSNFVVEGEKRYWLHIALSRDLNADGTVDVLGTQLEEVSE